MISIDVIINYWLMDDDDNDDDDDDDVVVDVEGENEGQSVLWEWSS